MTIRSKILASAVTLAGVFTGATMHTVFADAITGAILNTTSTASLASSGSTTASGVSQETNSGKTIPSTIKINVTAEPASGTFRGVVLVTLKADNPKAQIWYTTDPLASPGEALRYRKPVRIEKSAPLYFFAYTSEQSESKIAKETYVILPWATGSTLTWATASGNMLATNNPPKTPTKPTSKPKPTVITQKPTKPNTSNSGSILTSTGTIASGAIFASGSPQNLSGAVNPPSHSGSQTSSISSGSTKETIESLYREQAPLQKDEFKQLLDSSKTSVLDGVSSQSKTIAVAGLLVILVGVAWIRVIRNKKNILSKQSLKK